MGVSHTAGHYAPDSLKPSGFTELLFGNIMLTLLELANEAPFDEMVDVSMDTLVPALSGKSDELRDIAILNLQQMH